MALEALCGESRRSRRLANHDLLGDDTQQFAEGNEEYLTSFPNAVDPMKILAPPFVSRQTLDFILKPYFNIVFHSFSRLLN